jgi:hypothetical protein
VTVVGAVGPTSDNEDGASDAVVVCDEDDVAVSIADVDVTIAVPVVEIGVSKAA